jgi:hypothetical protein
LNVRRFVTQVERDGSNSCHALATFSDGSEGLLRLDSLPCYAATERRKGNFGPGRRREADAQQQVLKMWVRAQGADAGINFRGGGSSLTTPAVSRVSSCDFSFLFAQPCVGAGARFCATLSRWSHLCSPLQLLSPCPFIDPVLPTRHLFSHERP